MGTEALWKLYIWYVHVVKAKTTLAFLAIEVCVPVMMVTFASLMTDFVLQNSPTILKSMHNIVLLKKCQDAEYAALVHIDKVFLQVSQRHRLLGMMQCLIHQYAVGRWLNALCLQTFYYSFSFFHTRKSPSQTKRPNRDSGGREGE